MIRNPIHKVLLTLKKYNVQALLSGGQACILYGAAEFSRDTDFVILASPANIEALRKTLRELKAEQIFLPPLQLDYLKRGHACHFRCHHPACEGLRIDVISRLRGCDEFPLLWERRGIFDLPGPGPISLLSLPDLVQSKKTQRDRDWPMIRRLVEVDYITRKAEATEADILWWLGASRTPTHLIELAAAHPALLSKITDRPWLQETVTADQETLAECLAEEERQIRAEDRRYWQVLRNELEAMRHNRR